VSVSDKDLGYDRIMKELRGLGKDDPSILVGIRQKDGQKVAEGEELNLATIAAFNEFGTSTIPSRPFLRSTVDENRSKYGEVIAKGLRAAIDGRQRFKVSLDRLGLMVVSDVQKKITDNDFPRNAPSTIERKGSSKPLIDTGRLRQSIDYEIEGA